MKKILFAIDNLRLGGAERMILHQLRFIDRAKFDPWLLTILREPKDSLAKDAEFLGKKWVKIYPGKYFWGIFSWWKVYTFLRREKFDTVITSLFLTNSVVRFFAAIAGIPKIISYKQNVYSNKRWWQIFIDRALSRFTYKIIAVSKDVLEFTAKQEQIPKEKFALVYNAIPVENFETLPERNKLLKKLPIPPDAIVIATAGRLVKQKGHEDLLKAFQILIKKLPDKKIYCCIFGEGKERLDLEKEAKTLAIEGRLRMPGFWSAKDVLSVTDIFVLPSRREGLSLALLEAMAAGKPVISSDISGSNEVIENGINGILVGTGNTGELAEQLNLLVKDAELRARLGENARKRSRDFSIEKNVRALEELISDHG